MVKDRKGRVLSPGTPLEDEAIPEFLEKLAYVMEYEGFGQHLSYHLKKGNVSFTCEWMDKLDELTVYKETGTSPL